MAVFLTEGDLKAQSSRGKGGEGARGLVYLTARTNDVPLYIIFLHNLTLISRMGLV